MIRAVAAALLFAAGSMTASEAAPQLLKLSTAHLQVVIDRAQGDLVGVTKPGASTHFSAAPGAARDLWRLEVRSDRPRTILPSEARSFRFSGTANGPGTRLTWSDFGIADAPGLCVEATVRLDQHQPVSRWRIKVSGLGKLEPVKIAFPRVTEIPGKPEEQVAVPLWMGQHTSAIRRLLSDQGSHRLEWPYPGLLSMQCLAISAPGAPGIYLACDDAAAFHKAFALFAPQPGSLGCEVVHVPELGPERDTWEQPYNVVLGTLAGDWITAAERYREWATNQVWARQSRLATKSVPEWVLNTGLWVWNRGRSGQVLGPAAVLQKQLKLPVSVFWHWWHGCAYDSGFPEYLPPREGTEPFKSALADAHAQDVRALVYMNQRLWGMTTASWTNENARQYAVKTADGTVRPEVYNTFTGSPCASMCMGTEFWRDKYARLAESAVRDLGVDGIYMDQACTSLACYDPTHPHPPGGGTFWMQGFRSLAQDIRTRTRFFAGSALSPPTVVLAGEGCGESWLPYLDLMLSLQVGKERYAGDDGWETIPFFHAVYHAYGVTFGNYSSLTMPPYDDLWPAAFAPKEPLKLLDQKFARQFRLEQARAFVWGQQPTIANFQPDQIENRRTEIEFAMRLARLHSRATKYLMYGSFLRPPELHAPETTLDLSRLSIYAGQQSGLKTFEKRCPLALASAWRAPDGSIAVALASIADEPVRLRFEVDPKGWHVEGGTFVLSTAEKPNQRLGVIPDRATPVRITLPRCGAAILEMRR